MPPGQPTEQELEAWRQAWTEKYSMLRRPRMGQHKIPRGQKLQQAPAQTKDVFWVIVCAGCYNKNRSVPEQTRNTFVKLGGLYYCTACAEKRLRR